MNNNYKIAFFIPSLGGGGAERMMVNLVNEFSKKNKIFWEVINKKL